MGGKTGSSPEQRRATAGTGEGKIARLLKTLFLGTPIRGDKPVRAEAKTPRPDLHLSTVFPGANLAGATRIPSGSSIPEAQFLLADRIVEVSRHRVITAKTASLAAGAEQAMFPSLTTPRQMHPILRSLYGLHLLTHTISLPEKSLTASRQPINKLALSSHPSAPSLTRLQPEVVQWAFRELGDFADFFPDDAHWAEFVVWVLRMGRKRVTLGSDPVRIAEEDRRRARQMHLSEETILSARFIQGGLKVFFS